MLLTEDGKYGPIVVWYQFSKEGNEQGSCMTESGLHSTHQMTIKKGTAKASDAMP